MRVKTLTRKYVINLVIKIRAIKCALVDTFLLPPGSTSCVR